MKRFLPLQSLLVAFGLSGWLLAQSVVTQAPEVLSSRPANQETPETPAPAAGPDFSKGAVAKWVWGASPGKKYEITKDKTETLGVMDSVYLGPNEARAVENRTNMPASMLVIMPYPPKA